MVVAEKTDGQRQREIAEVLLILKNLPARKRERVFRLFSLLEATESNEDYQEIANAIGEILAKAGNRVPKGKTIDLDADVPEQAKRSVEEYYKHTGDTIRKRRMALKMTQVELAAKSGLPQSHICRLEVGKHAPTRVTIQRLAKALKTKPSMLDLLYD